MLHLLTPTHLPTHLLPLLLLFLSCCALSPTWVLGGTIGLQSTGMCSSALFTMGGSTTFDLNQLHIIGKGKEPFSARSGEYDENGKWIWSYEYKFNICGNISSPVTKPPAEAVKCPQGDAPAFQLKLNDDGSYEGECHRISETPTNTRWTLLDDHDPSLGVTYTYLGGEVCHSTNTPRNFSINFVCGDPSKYFPPSVAYNLNEIAGFAAEDAKCSYNVEFISKYACPTQCPIGANGVCNGGSCGYDPSIKSSRCFCLRDHYGPDCTQGEPVGSSCTGICLFLAFSIVLLCILLVAGSLVYWKVTKIIANQQRMGLSRQVNGQPGPTDSVKLQLDRDSEDSDIQRGGMDDISMQVMPSHQQHGINTSSRDQHLEQIQLDEDDEDLRDM